MAKKVLLVGSVAILFSACTPNSQSVEAQRARVADGARVEMRDANKKTVGTLTVSVQSGGGVRFNGRVSDLPPGGHGVHIHENGKCDPPDFKTAGAHLNLSAKQHGEHNPQGQHEGDIGNIRIDANGNAEVSLLAEKVSLEPGVNNSLLKPGGTSLVIHADPDDLKTDPSGNSGARIACGVITR